MCQLTNEDRDTIQRQKIGRMLHQLPVVMSAAQAELEAGKAPRWTMAALEQIAWVMRQAFYEKEDREFLLDAQRLKICLQDPCFDEASRRRLGIGAKAAATQHKRQGE